MTETTVRPAKLAHVVLRTSDKAAAVRWWTTVLGAEVRHEDAVLAFLTYDDEHHRLAVLEVPGMAPDERRTTGLEHLAFTYRDLDELLGTYERLKGLGIEPILTINHGMTFSMYYADPDGNQVELQIDTATPEEAERFMAGEVFAANPLGVLFDADDVVARRRDGESVESLTAYVPD